MSYSKPVIFAKHERYKKLMVKHSEAIMRLFHYLISLRATNMYWMHLYSVEGRKIPVISNKYRSKLAQININALLNIASSLGSKLTPFVKTY